MKYRVSEFAKLVGVSGETIRNYDISGEFKSSGRVGNQRRYSEQKVIEWNEKFGAKSTKEAN